jgi:cellulose biosynthesis protein BcsQ
MIYTFYSYKGGAGRSMTLANIAQWYYMQGLRVVIIDWDLEAPGLENYFFSEDHDLELVRSQIGLIDMLMAYKRQFTALTAAYSNDDKQLFALIEQSIPPLSFHLYPIYPASQTGEKGEPALWLLPAGLRSSDYFSAYSQSVQGFDWADFYTRFRGDLFFEWMRTQLEDQADVILIDSRTGVTEMGGVCTRQLADVVVSFCAPNEQNIAGLATMVESFRREEVLQARNGRPLDTVIVPARLDTSEIDARHLFRDHFLKAFAHYTPLSFGQVQRTFWDLKIPYIPKYAYSESLTIGASESVEELENAYKHLAASLVLLAPEKSLLRKRFTAELRRLFVFDSTHDRSRPRVFISYAPSDGKDFATNLRMRLAAEGIPLWLDRAEMDVDEDWWHQAVEALHQVESLVLIMTPRALESVTHRKLWLYARQQGVSIYPVKSHANFERSKLPRWLRNTHWYNLDEEWAEFLNDLNTHRIQPRIPFMVDDLPPNFVARPREFEALLQLLLDEERQSPVTITAALRGAGGYGKTALARAICHDERIQDAFCDGILWVTLGENPENLTGIIEDLIYILEGERVDFTSLEAASARFVEILAGRNVLLVIDDVWNMTHLKPFLRGGNRCARLITTRVDLVLPEAAQRITLDAMSQEEAAYLLIADLNTSITDDDRQALANLAVRLGEWPLLLRLTNGVLRERIDRGQSLSDALAFVNKALDKRGVVAFDASNALERSEAVSRTLDVSFSMLKPDEYDRYRELAVFPENQAIPIATVQKLWAITGFLDEFDTEELCRKFRSASLLSRFDLSAYTIGLHDVVRAYLRQIIGTEQLEKLHDHLLEINKTTY